MARFARVSIGGIGDLRRKLDRVMGAAKSEQVVGEALKVGARIIGEEIEAAMPTSRKRKPTKIKGRTLGRLKASVVKGKRGRTTTKGPSAFSAVDRKRAVQGQFLHTGTKYQRPRPEIFIGAVRSSRTRARNAVVERLLRIAWENL